MILVGLCFAVALPALPAQPRATVSIVVRSEQGDSIPFAHVHATTDATDVTVSANARGRVVLTLPFGRTHFVVSTLGYEALERDIAIDRPTVSTEFVLHESSQKLSGVEVREKWIGIRGGIGDEVTREPIAGAVVAISRGKIRVVTDSFGRFEIPLAKAEGLVLQIARAGYQSKPVRVDVLNNQPTDVVFFLAPGKDPLYMKVALGDLGHRMAATKINAFTANRQQLNKSGAVTLYDAIVSSGLLHKYHLTMGKTMCLFVNGLARPEFPVSTILVDDVDFIEVYGPKAEVTGTLMSEWPRGKPCTSHDRYFPVLGDGNGSRYVAIVSVWTRK